MRLAAARIFVRDLDRAAAFYRDRLQLPLKIDGRAHGFVLFFAGVDLLVEAVGDDADPDDLALVGRFTGLSFEVADIAAEHRRLSALEVPFDGWPEKQFWGGWLATFADPEGNRMQLVQRPAG